MNLDEINKQMLSLQNDFQNKNTNYSSLSSENVNSVNFQDHISPIETTQIKRPIKTGEHRNDINDKLNLMNTMSVLPKEISQNPPNTMPEFTRNYSTISPMQQNQMQQNQMQQNQMQQNQMQQNQMQQNQMQQNQMQQNQIQRQNSIDLNTLNTNTYSQVNQFANYYNHNFDTLQKNNTQKQMQQQQMQQQMPKISSNQDINAYMSESNSNMFLDTHSGGLPMINPRNMFSNNNYEEIPNKYNESGYNKVEDKKIDYRQNMNNKLDNFIFDNPNAVEPNPILMQQNYNKFGQTKDTRMIIQDSNKDFYRQSANDRMSQYSPLSRASNMPINMASMTVNDFYGNISGNGNQTNEIETSNKDLMNARIDKYAPLAKNIEYQLQNKQPMQPMQPMQPIDNINGKLQNVTFNNLPVMSNTVQNSMLKPIQKPQIPQIQQTSMMKPMQNPMQNHMQNPMKNSMQNSMQKIK
jgi:hypothetical protein